MGGGEVSTIQRQTPEWRISKALKMGTPRDWLDDNGYIRPEFREASDEQARQRGDRGYEARWPTCPGGGERGG